MNPFQRAEPENTRSAPAGEVLPALPFDLRHWQSRQEKALVEKALSQARFNQRRAAELLGVTYHQLRAMLKKHDINFDEA
ncbi:Psp operon transcriptional activator [compost metagenome]